MRFRFKIRLSLLIVWIMVVLPVAGFAASTHDPLDAVQDASFTTGLEFNGKDTYVELSKPFAEVPNTFEFWVKVPTSVPDNTRVGILLGSYVSGTTNNYATNIEIHTGGRLRAYWNIGKPDWYTPGFDARTGEWFHYCVVRDATGRSGFVGLRTYVNGELLASHNNPGASVIPKDPAKIGGDGRVPAGPIFNGRIGEIRVWSTTRSQEQIKQYMQAQLTGTEEGLLGYWKMDDGQGDTILDLSPYKNDGHIVGATWYIEKEHEVAASFTPIQYQRDNQSIHGSVVLTAKDHLPKIGLSVKASLFEMVWDSGRKSYTDKLYYTMDVYEQTLSLAPGSTEVEFQIPKPDHPGLWKVAYGLTLSGNVGLQLANTTHMFQNYPPAALKLGEPYTIAIFPDTQNFAENYPHIFTRMVDWVAQNAVEQNIGLLLHMV